MTVFATGGRARTMDFQAGDVGYVQKTLPHYVENTGDTDLKFLEMFKSSSYQDLALSEWLTPYAARSGHGTPGHRQGHARRYAQRRSRGDAEVVYISPPTQNPPEVVAISSKTRDFDGTTTDVALAEPRMRSEGETTTYCRSTVVVGVIGDAGAMRNGDGETAAHARNTRFRQNRRNAW